MFGFLAAAAIGSFFGSRASRSRRAPSAPSTRIEYRDNPDQVKRIKALEDQLKISQRRSEEMKATMAGIRTESERYRKQADETLAAADARLKEFQIATTKAEEKRLADLAAADERRRTETAAAEQRQKIAAQVGAANRLMEGRQADLQIQTPGDTPRTSGAQQFRRRKQQFNIPTGSYQGLGKIQSGMVNV
tara:strand:+ start:51 stop:623 length:573 start_codon:yes stop_codon:yes gene_type:complete